MADREREKGGGEEKNERQCKRRGGWIEINGGINGQMQRRKEGRSFTVDRLRQAELVKSLKMSQTCDSRLLNFMECCLSLVLLVLAFAERGWSLQ